MHLNNHVLPRVAARQRTLKERKKDMLFVITVAIKIVELVFWVLLSCAIGTALMFLLFLVHRWAERDDTRH